MEEGRPAQGPGSKAGPRGAPAAAVPPDLGRIARRRRRLPRNEWGPCRSRPRDAAAPSTAGAGSPFPAASFAQRGGAQPWGRPEPSRVQPDGRWRSRCRAVLRSWGDPPDVVAACVCLGLGRASPHPVLVRYTGRTPALEVLQGLGLERRAPRLA